MGGRRNRSCTSSARSHRDFPHTGADLKRPLEEYAGAELVAELERRFDTAAGKLTIAGKEISILRPRNSDDLIREEDFVKDERLPYWADVWPSSTILAAYLLERGGQPARMLELGCGVGLVTTAAMLAGHEVLASDYYTDALAFTRANAFRNTGRSPETAMFNWRSFPADIPGFDLLVASDVLYEKEYARLLPVIIGRALSPGGTALIADPGRIGVPEFFEACAEARLSIGTKQTFPFSAGEIRQSVDIFSIGRQP